MDGAEVVARVRSAIGQHCIYELGKGGMDPGANVPWDMAHGCDCSGYACWGIGISRDQAGHWLGTDQIDEDALMPAGLFTQIARADALPGDLIVFPHRTAGHHGHVGVVATTDATGPLTAAHCSLGNWSRAGDAIQETGCDVFWENGAIVARYSPPVPVA